MTTTPPHSTPKLPTLISTLSTATTTPHPRPHHKRKRDAILVLAVENKVNVSKPRPSTADRVNGEINPRGSPPSHSAQSEPGELELASESEGRVYAGSQGGDILVWSLHTLSLITKLKGHTGAVLALELFERRNWLASSSGDRTIRIWHTPTLSPVYIIHLPNDNVGDIFSLTWAGEEEILPSEAEVVAGAGASGPDHETTAGHSSTKPVSGKGKGRLYAGCQDTSIQWIDLPPTFHLPTLPSLSTSASTPPILKPLSRFFDSISPSDRPFRLATSRNSESGSSLVDLGKEGKEVELGAGTRGAAGAEGEKAVVELQFGEGNIERYSHSGYVYCLTTAKSNDHPVLISGSGDELVQLWSMTPSSLIPLSTLSPTPTETSPFELSGAVLTLKVRDNTLFVGHQGGVIRVWDLDTFVCLRVLKADNKDVLALTILEDALYVGGANGSLQKWELERFSKCSEWRNGGNGGVFASQSAGGRVLVTGGVEGVKLWDVIGDEIDGEKNGEGEIQTALGFNGPLFHTLAKFVSFKTIADEDHREECRQGALYLKRVLQSLGAETALLPGAIGRNPLVLATFHANVTKQKKEKDQAKPERKKRVLVYGHYDVVDADRRKNQWSHDPFEMTGKNGSLYGRGVSDNKGPVLAMAAAASELRFSGQLEVDVVMVLEGEEETGSVGFQEAIKRNKDVIGPIDVILVSNSYWIGEEIPCLTFGLRGVIKATVRVNSDQPDLHSGMQGGVVSEPLNDLVRLLASLTNSEGVVMIPDFLSDVATMTDAESALYDAVIARNGREKLRQHSHVEDPLESLLNRWRKPALSIHRIEVSGPSQTTLIPSWATCSLSIRIVPDQSLSSVVAHLEAHLQKSFSTLKTWNKLVVSIDHLASWWLGSLTSPYFLALSKCVENEWGIKPLYIREGGSIPSIPFLEREFGVDAVHLPMGQGTDGAHLKDERVRAVNLEKGKIIVKEWLMAIAQIP